MRLIYVFDVEKSLISRKLSNHGPSVSAMMLPRDKIDKINSILLEGIKKKYSLTPPYKNIRFTLLKRKITKIKADAFCRI